MSLCKKPCIVALSPDPANCKSLWKDEESRALYMGPVSLEEAQLFRGVLRSGFSRDILIQRFSIVGGILRFLFRESLGALKEKQTEALEAMMTRPRLIDSGSVPKDLKSLWSIYHLYHIGDEHGNANRSFTITLCGDDIRARLRDILLQKSKDELWHLYIQTEDRHGALKGIRYEAYTHKKLMAGYDGTATGVIKKGIGQRTLQVAVPPQVSKVELPNNDLREGLQDCVAAARTNVNGAYSLPHLSNFPVVDSIYMPQGQGTVVLLQMKAGRIKPLSGDKATSILASVGGTAKLIFVVPDELTLTKAVQHSTQAGPQNLHQYRLVLRE